MAYFPYKKFMGRRMSQTTLNESKVIFKDASKSKKSVRNFDLSG